VAFNDQNGDGLYSMGEGAGNVTIEVDDSNNEKVAATTTWDAGGYQIPLAPGSYKVTALVNNQVVRTQDITIGNDNVEADYDLSPPWQGGTLPSGKGASTQQSQAPVQNQNQNSQNQNSQNQNSQNQNSQSQNQNQNQNDPSQVAMPSPPNFDGSW